MNDYCKKKLTKSCWFGCLLFFVLVLAMATANIGVVFGDDAADGDNAVDEATTTTITTDTATDDGSTNAAAEEMTCSVDDQSCQKVAGAAEDMDEDDATENDDEDDNKIAGTLNPDCIDEHKLCESWAGQGECDYNADYMLKSCRLSCMVCQERIYSEEELYVGADIGVPQIMEMEGDDDLSKDMSSQQISLLISKTRDFLVRTPSSEMPPTLKRACENTHPMCTIQALLGECETNFEQMKTKCAAVCQSCVHLTREGRCPIDPNEPNVWGPGDLDKMFSRLTEEPYLSKYDVKILSSPHGDNTTILEGPWVITMENVLSPEEAQTIIELGSELGYERSTAIGKINADGSHKMDEFEGRTSSNTWCKNACWENNITQGIISRMSDITEIPQKNSEYLQLLKYAPGQKYVEHHGK